VVVHPAPGSLEGTLVHALLDRGLAGGEDPLRPGVVHRLDKDTSGLLVLAKSEEARASLAQALRDRRVERTYVALVHGRPAARAGRIEAPIGRDGGRLTRQAVDGVGAREAVTHFRLLEALRRFSLLEVHLETGRTHQIRVHLQAVGHPVVGDPVYGASSAPTLGLDRQFLHAVRLGFPHPVGGERLDLESPLPADLEHALAAARAEG
jgi:23S rRNA pseudouridine1911/1915/1917 synthase